MKDDSLFMQRALALGRKGLGRTAPNPPVGAVVVKDGLVAGEGFHPKAGLPHAEVFALKAAGETARGGTLYVTLEPCSHSGKTSPCTDAVMKAGISRVVVGAVDPNPLVAGSGIRILREHGIEVEVGVEAEECARLIRWYATWMEKKRPYVIVKAAMTLDGRIATPGGDSKWISSEESRAYVHSLRARVDGVLVGIGTVSRDDPLLTCRAEDGRDPLRIILDQGYTVPPGAKCLGGRALVMTGLDPQSRPEVLASGAQVVRLPLSADGHFLWNEVLGYLGGLGLHAVLVEGGSSILSSLILSGLVDELLIFIAPKLLGGGVPLVAWKPPETVEGAVRLAVSGVETMGGDVVVTAHLEG